MQDDAWSLPEIGWPTLNVHPIHLIDNEDRALLDLWRAYKAGHLPVAGGVLDQPACVMTCLDIMSETEALLKPAPVSR